MDRKAEFLKIWTERVQAGPCGRRRYGLPYEVKRVFFTGGSRK